MKRRVLSIVWAFIICCPCILTFSCGANAPIGQESIGWMNFVGLAWMGAMVFGGFRMLTPKWMREELKALFPDEN